jgi:hypothetical protein
VNTKVDNSEPDFSYLDDAIEATGVELVNDEAKGPDSQSGQTDSSQSGTSASDKIEGADGKDKLSGEDDKSAKPGEEKKAPSADGAKLGEVKPGPQPDGSLVLQDGKKINAGAERRYWDQWQFARQRETVAKNELNTAKQNYENLQTKYTALEGSVKALGLADPAEASVALQMYKDLQADPPAFLTKLLAEAKAKGYKIEGLAGAVDTAAITQILDQKLKPSETEQREAKAQEIAQQVENEISELLTNYPDALTHEAFIAAVVESEAKQGRQVSLVDAYVSLKQKVLDDGLDWTQPLGPQLQARRQQGQQQQQQQKQDDPPRQPGRHVQVGASEEISPDKVFAAENEYSTDDIVRAAMREAGMKV